MLIDVQQSIELGGPDDLKDDEQRTLFDNLALFPIQYGAIHTYRHDDA